MSLDPFAPPRAKVEQDSADPARRVGRFWGWIFAMPFVGLLTLSSVGTLRFLLRQNSQAAVVGVGLDALCVALLLMTLVCGAWWARRFSQRGWPLVFGFALAAGLAGQVVFWTGLITLFSLFSSVDSHSATFNFSKEDAVSILWGWLGTSLYALLQGILVRWSLKRRARRLQGSVPAAAPLS